MECIYKTNDYNVEEVTDIGILNCIVTNLCALPTTVNGSKTWTLTTSDYEQRSELWGECCWA